MGQIVINKEAADDIICCFLGMISCSCDLYCWRLAALAGADGPTPAPVTVALFVRDATPRSSCLTVYAALQVNVAFGARLTFASPQLKAVGLIRLSLIVN